MSTSSTNPFSALPSLGSSQLANGAAFNVTGLASGLDTNSLISSLIAVQRAPVTLLSRQQQRLQAQQQQLQSIQTALQSLATNVAGFVSPGLFTSSQSVTSANPTLVAATTTGGAGVGGYEVDVTQLANSAQRTFSFTTPAAADTITIDGHDTNVAAGASAQDLANAINADGSATVWAAVTASDTVVFSNRATGDTGGNFIQVSETGTSLTEQANKAKQGQNAEFTVDGTPFSEASNTVKDAIAGVTLTLNSRTPTAPVTITVQPPAPSTSNIQSAVQSFVTQYNSTIAQIQTQLTQTPVKNASSASDLGQGTLFQDQGLQSLLNDMRQAMYTPINGQPAGFQSLADIGISTGAATAGGVTSQSTLQGQLQVDTDKLAQAIQANPTAVQNLLQSWSTSFQARVNVDAGPGGTIDTRVQTEGTDLSGLQSQITTMNQMLNVRQAALEQQFAALEGTLSQSQAQSSWLTSQITSMTVNPVR